MRLALLNAKRLWRNALLLSALTAAAEPLRIHPDNPHYFLFRGKATVLITSGEHYGAVLNRPFDFRKYLDTLAADNLNLTRVFTGLYREVPGESFEIARTVADTEANWPGRHLISRNIANGVEEISNPDPFVSIFNFHYARPPGAVAMNYKLNKPIGMNETGFDGTNDAPYRIQAWDFLLAGGALYNNLDYSFTTEHETALLCIPALSRAAAACAFDGS